MLMDIRTYEYLGDIRNVRDDILRTVLDCQLAILGVAAREE